MVKCNIQTMCKCALFPIFDDAFNYFLFIVHGQFCTLILRVIYLSTIADLCKFSMNFSNKKKTFEKLFSKNCILLIYFSLSSFATTKNQLPQPTKINLFNKI